MFSVRNAQTVFRSEHGLNTRPEHGLNTRSEHGLNTPGEHVVELRYSSWTTRLSRWFMGASLVVVLALVGWDLKRRRSAAPSGAA